MTRLNPIVPDETSGFNRSIASVFTGAVLVLAGVLTFVTFATI
jgi:hypothetical protein